MRSEPEQYIGICEAAVIMEKLKMPADAKREVLLSVMERYAGEESQSLSRNRLRSVVCG